MTWALEHPALPTTLTRPPRTHTHAPPNRPPHRPGCLAIKDDGPAFLAPTHLQRQNVITAPGSRKKATREKKSKTKKKGKVQKLDTKSPRQSHTGTHVFLDDGLHQIKYGSHDGRAVSSPCGCQPWPPPLTRAAERVGPLVRHRRYGCPDHTRVEVGTLAGVDEC